MNVNVSGFSIECLDVKAHTTRPRWTLGFLTHEESSSTYPITPFPCVCSGKYRATPKKGDILHCVRRRSKGLGHKATGLYSRALRAAASRFTFHFRTSFIIRTTGNTITHTPSLRLGYYVTGS